MIINNAIELLQLMENNKYISKSTNENKSENNIQVLFDKTIKGEYCLPLDENNTSAQIDFARLIVKRSHQLNWLQYAYLLRYLIINNPIITAVVINQGSKYGNRSLLVHQILDNKFLE